jgi:hypothetical protein
MKQRNSVRVRPVIRATDPETKLLIFHGDHPAPILRYRLLRLKPTFPEIVTKELGQALSRDTRVNLSILALVGGEPVGAKLDKRLH